MPEWLDKLLNTLTASNSDIGLPFIGIIIGLFLIISVSCLILLWRIKRADSNRFVQLNQNLQKLTESVNYLSLSQGNFQRQIQSMLADNQAKQFSMILNDRQSILTQLNELQVKQEQRLAASNKEQSIAFNLFSEKLSQLVEQNQRLVQKLITDNIQNGTKQLLDAIERSLNRQNQFLIDSIGQLTQSTDERLKEISGQVDKRLADGFNQTNQTFNDVIKRLALIDSAQQKITELSSNVVSLQEILNDKRSRGAFGEVQLNTLIANVMPATHYKLQYKLSNNKIVDCLLLLPQPTGKIAIDAKFPLENYRKMSDLELAQPTRDQARRLFIKDIKKHIDDIAQKYILPPETSSGAVMFIPAESIFAEIHGHLPELVELAQQKRVWLVSPTTLVAILTTASAVVKDEQTRQQVHLIKEHITYLAKDFNRFQERMDNLAKHIGQVSKDVENVHVSARKISTRFDKIEKVELSDESQTPKKRIEELHSMPFTAVSDKNSVGYES
ncbi:DNA recombination protein RmuC [Aliikangiella maris]|uniref:DNA recombination protein RmuC n=2 Tax=Aliikangiella maris TaxID=3162458 RepID=A0ABV3MJG2_9GAMM